MLKLLVRNLPFCSAILVATLFVGNGILAAEIPASSIDNSDELAEAAERIEPNVQTPDKTMPEVRQVPVATDNTAIAQTPAASLEQINQYNQEAGSMPQVNSVSQGSSAQQSDPMSQVTNVSQLSDVRPTDWAYEALRSLVERYGCIAGYPDGTFRGNRAMTRYEFAAGVNACLQQIERLIQSSTGNFVTKPDLETLQRLVDEFRTELTALGGRVDKLEGRVAFLEDHQFSTTTKLRGEVVFAISDLFGEQAASRRAFPGARDYANTETVFQDRVRLNFDTSFTGKDLLRTRLQARNIVPFGPLSGPTASGTNITREGRFATEGDTGNSVQLDRLFYRFPVGKIAQVYLGANALQYEDFVDLLNPGLDGSGTGAISRFGQYSPIYRVGGQSQGIGVSIGAKLPVRVDLGYLTNVGNNPNEKFGLFDGNYSALGQVTFQPTSAFRIAGTYVHSYSSTGSNLGLGHGTGSIESNIQGTGRPVIGNSYGVEAVFALTPQLAVSGWGSLMNATAIGLGNADIWTYGGRLAINDFGTKGSTLAFIVGMEPKLTGTSNANFARQISGLQVIDVGRRRDRDTSLHIEALYKFKLSNNILITPGVIWLTAPGHDSRNDDIFIGTLRTTFTF
jgi:hypothetical protein